MEKLAQHGAAKVIILNERLVFERAKKELRKRLHEEEDRLLFLRKAMERLSFNEVLGEASKLPRTTPMDLIPGR
jgi:hypothetical protein